MAVKLIDTKTLHPIDIDGTVFHVRAFDWAASHNYSAFAQKTLNPILVAGALSAKRSLDKEGGENQIDEKRAGEILKSLSGEVTQSDKRMFIDLINESVESITGLESYSVSKREFLERMKYDDLELLAAQISRLSKLDEETEKNLSSLCSSSETTSTPEPEPTTVQAVPEKE